MPETKKYKIVIPSVLEKLYEVEELSEKVAVGAGLPEEDVDNMSIAVTEAVNNAIKHGNKGDASKNVFIDFVVGTEKLTVTVKDQGAGFDPASLKNPIEPENLLNESGRGIFILKALMDEVDFSFQGNGTVITLKKNLK